MKTIGVSKQLRQYIKDVSLKEDKSVDATLNRLMDNTIKPNHEMLVGGRTNINISEETYARLNEYRLYNTEAIVGVILRLILNDNSNLNDED